MWALILLQETYGPVRRWYWIWVILGPYGADTGFGYASGPKVLVTCASTISTLGIIMMKKSFGDTGTWLIYYP